MTENNVTIDELSRRLAEMRVDMREGFLAVSRRLDTLQYVSQDVYRSEMAAMAHRLTVQEDESVRTRRGVIFSFMYPTILTILNVLLVVQR